MSYLFFFAYLFLFCWLITKIKFFEGSGLNNRIIVILFLLRIIAGLVNGWINLYYYSPTDSAWFHENGLIEYHLLFNNPKEYFINIFHNTHKSNYAGLLDANDSFWNDLRTNIIIKLLSIFNIFSRGNYFINTLFYNFLIFFGAVSIYKVYAAIFPAKRNLIIAGVFILPSALYFTSGIHREGLIFLGLGIVSYQMYNILREKITLLRTLYVLGGLLLIFLLRNFVFITLIPALIAWIIAEKRRKFLLQTFILVYVFFGIVFFSLSLLHPKLDLPQYVSTRQQLFLDISKLAGSAININPLYPNFRSFLNNAPQALNHSLMRPYLTETNTILYVPLSIEILVYEIILLLFLFSPQKISSKSAFIHFGIFLSLCMCLIIGYTIPIIGALVRYRSIYFPMLITPLLCYIDFKEIKLYFNYKNK